MIQGVDTTLVDTSAAFGYGNIIVNNGDNVAFSGIAVVFIGLVLISVTIVVFNLVIKKLGSRDEKAAQTAPAGTEKKRTNQKAIPPDHLAAIAAAIELYRLLHFDQLESRVTFERGEPYSGWKTGARYGQRHTLR